ncbi:MAG: ferritin-like domain-containing protein [Rhodospirillales bacterium]|nr:ferritin-like domain-containing protein [Rhodospirillales bacterium]
MPTTIGTESDVAALFNDLIKLDHDAIQAYEAAINKLDNAAWKRELTAFRSDHVRHTEELAAVVRDLGQEPPSGPDMKQMLTVGKVALAEVFGDKAILRAMKTNEDDTNTAYERAAGRSDLPASAVPVVRAALADERRHRDWIEKTIAAA